MALLWLGGCTQVWAVPALQEVKVNPLLADQLLLELSFSEPVSGFTDRLTYEPNQLLLHVPGAIGALTVNPLPIKQQGVNNLLVEGKGQGLDIKIALDQLTPYQVHQQGNKLGSSRDLGEVEVDRQGAGKLAVSNTPPPSPCCRRASY